MHFMNARRLRVNKALYQKSLYIPAEEILKEPTLHFCPDWDDLVIDKNDPEFECCLCFKKESKQTGG